MLESFLSDFAFIKDTLDKEGDHNFFGRNFSFFSTQPILFYNSERDTVVYVNSNFTDEFNYTVDDLAEWKYSIYPLLNSADHDAFREAMKSLVEFDGASSPDATYKLITKNKTHSYYRVKIRKLHKSYYFIQLENSVRAAIPVLKNKTADDLMNGAECILKFGFWMQDNVTEKLFWTKGMFELLEYDDVGDVVPSVAFLHEHIIKDDTFLDFEKKLNNGELKDSYRIKYHIRTNKNNILTVSEHGRIERDEKGTISRMTGLMRDITLQEESMKSLADYKSMMQENESFLDYGTWESNADGSDMLWTNGMYKIFGYDEPEKQNMHVNRDMYVKHMIDAPSMGSTDTATAFLEGKDFYHRDFEIKDEKGVIRLLSTYAKIVRNKEEVIQKIIGTTRDVTQIRENEKILESKIAELNRSNTELEEFAYVASHDMQEPLRKISTFGQRLKNQFTDQLGDDGNMYLNRMLNAADNMRKLIDNLLEFSRISRSRQAYEQTDLGATIKSVMDDLDMPIGEASAKISVSEMPVIEAIPSQMRQLFFNLLHNALKFRKKDTTLEIKIKQKKMTAVEKASHQLTTKKEYFLIALEDNGIGLEQQYAERIFQLFQRLEGKSEYPGTGIGLSICRKIVTNHKGWIFANGEPGIGTTFSIILPQEQQ
jgi:signal transduction histidine kinase